MLGDQLNEGDLGLSVFLLVLVPSCRFASLAFRLRVIDTYKQLVVSDITGRGFVVVFLEHLKF